MAIEARLSQIYIAEAAGAPMQRLGHVQAIRERGLMGDRYENGTGFWQNVAKPRETVRHVTLISQAGIDSANAEFGTNFDGAASRRNLVVAGEVDLMSLKGKTFMVGDVLMKGVEECTPCVRPSQLSGEEGFQRAFRPEGRGGLRAEVLTSGLLIEGDPVIILGCNRKK